MVLILSRDCSQVEVDTAQLRGLELSRASVHAAEQRTPKSICSVAEGNGRAPDLLIAAEVVPPSSTTGSSQYLYIPLHLKRTGLFITGACFCLRIHCCLLQRDDSLFESNCLKVVILAQVVILSGFPSQAGFESASTTAKSTSTLCLENTRTALRDSVEITFLKYSVGEKERKKTTLKKILGNFNWFN